MTDDSTDENPAATVPLDARRRPSEAVVAAVSAATGRSSRDLDRLYDVLDPDALDALFARRYSSGDTPSVSFHYAGCTVVVEADAVTADPSE